MRNFIKTVAIVFLLVTAVCSQSKKAEVSKPNDAKSLLIKYIANEGVLISSGGKTILIDGLHREYKPDYLFPPADLLKSLETAATPYDKINLLLVSHLHLDHFHPQSIGLHLKNNPKAILATSEQIIGEIAKSFADYEKLKSQIKPISHEWKKPVEYNQDGIKVRFLGLRHGGENFKWIQNFGHLIELNGKKLLHLGDADMTAENFSTFNLSQENIDVAFIPYWFLLSENGRKLVKEQFNPKQIIAAHIPPKEAEEITERFKKDNRDVITFSKLLEERSF